MSLPANVRAPLTLIQNMTSKTEFPKKIRMERQDMTSMDKAIRNKGLERSLKVKIPQEVYDTLKKELSLLEER